MLHLRPHQRLPSGEMVVNREPIKYKKKISSIICCTLTVVLFCRKVFSLTFLNLHVPYGLIETISSSIRPVAASSVANTYITFFKFETFKQFNYNWWVDFLACTNIIRPDCSVQYGIQIEFHSPKKLCFEIHLK